ncbi:MAG: MATE family efflux transporter [Clostridia bacterium]|nr:MATE family efflux transporter [Clostridia bacterium]
MDESLSIRFVVPVIAENCLSIFIGMAVSVVVSGISSSALAAIGMANTVITVISAFFSVVTTGTSILVSRQAGAGEYVEVADTIEQSTFLSLVTTAVFTTLFVAFASPVMRLLMPTAEAVMFGEAVRYFRVLMLSLPFLILQSVFAGVCRGLGNSRVPMAVSIVTSLCHLFFSWLTIDVLGWNEMGAGAALIVCRVVGATLLLAPLMRDRRHFVLKFKNMITPKLATCKRIVRLGIPVSLESTFVQVGYMLGNTMAIALGTFESGVYQIINTINGFTSVPQGICTVIAMSVVGHLLGRKEYKNAKKAGWLIWVGGLSASALLGFTAWGFGEFFCGLYSSDPATVTQSAGLLWILLFMNATGCSINVIDPQLRVGGDVRWVMVCTLVAVWAIRLPLTYLMCFCWDFGVLGIFLANTISLAFRMLMGIVRYCGSKWMYQRV